MKYYAVIDTNVLVSAMLKWESIPGNIVQDILDQMERAGIYIDAEELGITLPDLKDIVFYEVVMEERKSEDAYLVTGNLKHFPAKPYVVTPRQMLDIIIENISE